MKSLSYQAKLELSKTNFSVCNLGLTSFTKETMESPRPQNVSGRTTAVSNSPTLKMKKLSIPAFEKAAARKKELSPKFKQSKSYKTTDFVQDSLDTYTFRNTKRTDFHTKTEEVESPLKPNRVSSAVSDSSPSPTPRRASSVRIVSLNQQIGMQTKSNNEEKASTAFQQKFAKKYTHFKRTQNNAFMHCLGRFKSIAEINDRVSSIHVEPTLKQTFADWEKEIAKACPTEREKAVMQKQVKQIVRLRRKILDGEIDFSKYCTDKDNRFALDKNQENFISAQPTNLLRPQNSMNVWLQGQNPEADQAIENPLAHHQKRSYVTSARESVRIRQDNGKVEPVKVLKNEMVNETHRKNTVSNVVSYRDPKNVSSKDKVRVNRTRTHSNAPTRQFVNMHTEKMKYKPQSLEVSLIADSRGPKSLIDGTTLDSPDKTVMEPETLKNALMEVKGERSIGLPVISREMLRGISKSNGDSANNQEQRAKERSKSKEAKGSGIDDIMNLKVEGWSRNEKQKIKKSK